MYCLERKCAQTSKGFALNVFDIYIDYKLKTRIRSNAHPTSPQLRRVL